MAADTETKATIPGTTIPQVQPQDVRVYLEYGEYEKSFRASCSGPASLSTKGHATAWDAARALLELMAGVQVYKQPFFPPEWTVLPKK